MSDPKAVIKGEDRTIWLVEDGRVQVAYEKTEDAFWYDSVDDFRKDLALFEQFDALLRRQEPPDAVIV